MAGRRSKTHVNAKQPLTKLAKPEYVDELAKILKKTTRLMLLRWMSQILPKELRLLLQTFLRALEAIFGSKMVSNKFSRLWFCAYVLQYTNIYTKTEPYQISVKPTLKRPYKHVALYNRKQFKNGI
jgi:hypothetical protein